MERGPTMRFIVQQIHGQTTANTTPRFARSTGVRSRPVGGRLDPASLRQRFPPLFDRRPNPRQVTQEI
jgi:hypothetical protein